MLIFKKKKNNLLFIVICLFCGIKRTILSYLLIFYSKKKNLNFVMMICYKRKSLSCFIKEKVCLFGQVMSFKSKIEINSSISDIDTFEN